MSVTKKVILFLLTVALFSSCQNISTIRRPSDDGLMFAMIYDFDNNPINTVAVYINERRVAESDIQGRFILANMNRGEYAVRLTKRGYETLEGYFHFDPLQVLYFRMINTSQLLTHAETAMDRGEFPIAENYIKRALAIEPNRPDILFLKSISYFSQQRYQEAITVLHGLIRAGNAENAIIQLLEMIQKAQEELYEY